MLNVFIVFVSAAGPASLCVNLANKSRLTSSYLWLVVNGGRKSAEDQVSRSLYFSFSQRAAVPVAPSSLCHFITFPLHHFEMKRTLEATDTSCL